MENLPLEPKQKFCLQVHKQVASSTHVHAHTCLGFAAVFLPRHTLIIGDPCACICCLGH